MNVWDYDGEMSKGLPYSRLSPRSRIQEYEDPRDFEASYAEISKRLGINPNPYDPRHEYDSFGAYLMGHSPDAVGHGPSEFKTMDHPRRYLPQNRDGSGGLFDTASGLPAPISILDLLGWSE